MKNPIDIETIKAIPALVDELAGVAGNEETSVVDMHRTTAAAAAVIVSMAVDLRRIANAIEARGSE